MHAACNTVPDALRIRICHRIVVRPENDPMRVQGLQFGKAMVDLLIEGERAFIIAYRIIGDHHAVAIVQTTAYHDPLLMQSSRQVYLVFTSNLGHDSMFRTRSDSA